MMLNFIPLATNHFNVVLGMMEDFFAIDKYPFQRAQTEKNLILFVADETLGCCYLLEIDGQWAGYFVICYGFSFEHNGKYFS